MLYGVDGLALAYMAAGKPDLALPLFEETLRIRKAKLGAEHLDTLQNMNNLAGAYWAVGSETSLCGFLSRSCEQCSTAGINRQVGQLPGPVRCSGSNTSGKTRSLLDPSGLPRHVKERIPQRNATEFLVIDKSFSEGGLSGTLLVVFPTRGSSH